MSTVVIIQARLGSKRFPGKTLKELHGYPIINWVVNRVKKASLIEKCCIAIPDHPSDDPLAEHLFTMGESVYRGDEMDVLGRVTKAALKMNASNIVRVCADNPLVCPKELDNLIRFYLDSDLDYAFNHIPFDNLYPDGFGGEICNINTLKKVEKKAISRDNREHMFNYIWKYSDEFKIGTFDPIPSLRHPNLRFDVDTISDLDYLNSQPFSIGMTATQIIKKFL